MELKLIDVVFFAVFFAAVVGISMYMSRRERTSEGYFLAGRSLPWWLIGISIIAANLSTEQFVGMAGKSAGGEGLAVSSWQLVGTLGIVLIAFTLLPRFLRAGIYTMPEYLEYRYNVATRSIMALLTVIIYVTVLLTAVLYSGGITLRTIFGMDLHVAVWVIGAIAAIYTTWGGLKAVAWADLFQGFALLAGGFAIFALGLHACGGWDAFVAKNAGRLHMILPADHESLPWTGVASGMWIVIVYYCGLNQFIVQRNLAAKTLRDGQLGVIFAGALWMLVPFAIVMPGIMAHQLYGADLAKSDAAFPTLIARLVPPGLRGFIFAAIAGAVISSLASMLNSASTVFTMDIYRRLFDRKAPQGRLVLIGRVLTVVFVLAGCTIAPMLDDPDVGGVFEFIQQYQGYIWPGVVAVFLFGIVVPQAPGAAGVAGLVAGPAIYLLFQRFAPNLNFLVAVAATFQLVVVIMGLITFWKPLAEPRTLPVRQDLDVRTSPAVRWIGAAVIAAVVVFYIVFW
ncbi:MAG: sodium/solute symporter [Planctomycetes bacterium]|nr:sodium/solute symporter [Planctomycetota bacterium]